MSKKNTIKNKGGRPAVYSSPEEMEAKIEEYFSGGCHKKSIILKEGLGVEMPFYTIAGLAYHLGFESRQSFYDYEDRPGFSYIIKKARLRIEMMYEEGLQASSPTGSIFALKNMGWKDRSELEMSGGVVLHFDKDDANA